MISLIPIKYNFKKPITGLEAVVFLFILTKDYKADGWVYCFKRKRFFNYA